MIEIQKRGLNLNFSFDDHWILLDEIIDGMPATKPDFFWFYPYLYAVYLDGDEVHPKPRDDKIDAALERLEYKYDRFLYTVPLSLRERDKIVNKIQSVLEEMNYIAFKG